MSGEASGSRYAPLPVDPLPDNEHDNGNTPVPSRIPSPTPTLQPIVMPTTWTFDNVEYDSLNAVLDAIHEKAGGSRSAVENISYIASVISAQAAATCFNTLGNKIYEHANGQHELNVQIDSLIKKLIKKTTTLRDDWDTMVTLVGDLQKENEELRKENRQFERDMDQLNDNMHALLKEFRTLKNSTVATSSGHSAGSKPKVAEPPKYKGNKSSDITLEQWLQKMGLWFRHHNISGDEDKITMALMYLEGGAQSYMDDYIEKAAVGLMLGSWDDFISRLKSGYRQLAPEKSAQQSLEELCAKTHSSISKFAEDFRRFASKSGYSDVELIRRIDAQVNKDVRGIMITHRQLSPATVPTKWENYLDWVLSIEMQFRDNPNSRAHQHTPVAPRAKDPNAMDVDAIRKPEKLAKEQETWLAEGKCFRCGKHPYRKNEKCRNPQYKGFYELPERKAPAKSQVRNLKEEPSGDEHSKMEYLRRALEEFEKGKGKANETASESETVGRIVNNEEDFLQRVL